MNLSDVEISCCVCSILFNLPVDIYNQRREDHGIFWCPQGHEQHFTGPSETQKLKARIKYLKQQNEWESQNRTTWLGHYEHEVRRRTGYQGMIKRLQNEIARLKS